MKKFRQILVWLVVISFFPLGLLTSPLKAQAAASLNPTIQFTKTGGSGLESVTPKEIEISLGAPAAAEVTVDYKITGGTATDGIDYDLKDGTTKLAAGVTTADIDLTIINNKTIETDRTVEITLSDPVNADLGLNTVYTYTIIDDDAPLTTAITVPNIPNGQNGWFISVPQIKLIPNQAVNETYFQWNSPALTNPEVYIAPITALQGENILYYYSVNKLGDKEDVRWLAIKVDTVNPAIPIISAQVGDDGFVYLSWNTDPDVASYEIWQGTNVKKVAGTVTSYVDKTVGRDQSYQYQIAAIDQAGNYSAFALVQVTVPSLPSPPAVIASPTPTVVTPAVQPAIGEGVQIHRVRQTIITPQTAGVSEEKTVAVKPPQTTEEQKAEPKSWSRLLVAISILIIAAGAAIAGYYGYEWWMSRKEEPPSRPSSGPKNQSRW